MSDDQGVTPIDRPLMRSDLNEIRQIVFSISQRQIYERRDSFLRTVVCVACMLVSIGCAYIGIHK